MDHRSEAVRKSKEHWEMDVSSSIFPKPRKNVQQDNFIAKGVKEWPKTHIKINDQDN
jgi:hypothetical protein